MSKGLFVSAILGLTALFGSADLALAASCGQLENMLRQARASGHQGNVVIASQALARQGCRGQQSRPSRRLGPRMLVLPQFERRAAPPRRAAPTRRRSNANPSVERRASVARQPAARERRRDRERGGISVRSGRTYRTWCVRSCDGYYFPISYSTTRQQFDADQASCEQMCPGSAAELFIQPAGETGRESMQSIAGQAYVDLPTAFQYRTGVNPSCTCGAENNGQSVALLQAQIPTDAEKPDQPGQLPQGRPAPGDDPETVANRLGGFTTGVQVAPPALVQSAPGGLRQVLAGQEQSTALLAPVQSSGAGEEELGRQMLLLLPSLMLGRVPTL